MTEIKPVHNLEEVKNIQEGDIIGVNGTFTTLTTLCIEKNQEEIRLIGQPYGVDRIIDYTFKIEEIRPYTDGNIFSFQREKGKMLKEKLFRNKEYYQFKEKLIDANLWKGSK